MTIIPENKRPVRVKVLLLLFLVAICRSSPLSSVQKCLYFFTVTLIRCRAGDEELGREDGHFGQLDMEGQIDRG